MIVLKCKMCGGDLSVEEEKTVCECEYCGTKQTIPVIDDEKKAKLYDRANRLRINCEFDKAAGVYENIVSDYPAEAEGYWGLILCRYGIEYVDDPLTGKKIPTCHRSSFDSVMDDEDFEMVMENADVISRALYREEAKYIEEIRKGIIEVSGKEEPYDIFICYKETDENGERTLDSVLAQDVYDELTRKGYRVFFSRITLEDKLGVEYEPYIFAALHSAKIMLAFGTSYDYYNAVWVKNEWSRYLKLMAKDKSKHLIPCFKNVDAYDIPKEFAKLQAQDLGKIGAIQDLMRGIDKLIAPRNVVSEVPPADKMVMNAMVSNGDVFVKRGFMAIEDGQWDKATDFFEQALNLNAENGIAYWGELMAEYKCKDIEEMSEFIFQKMCVNVTEEQKPLEIDDKYPEYLEKYKFLKLLSQDDENKLFHRTFYYSSSVGSITELIEKNRKELHLKNNRLYQRAIRYANDEVQRNKEALEKQIDEILENEKAKLVEKQRMSEKQAKQEADEYLSKLENALQIANALAEANYHKSEAGYQDERAKWEQERDSFGEVHAAWEQDLAQKKLDYQKWREENACLKQYDEQRAAYLTNKRMLEAKIQQLELEKNMIEGILAQPRIEKKEKEIMQLRIRMSKLPLPVEPKVRPAPVMPTEPKLRAEPVKSSYEVMINEKQVLDALKKAMQ